VILSLSFSKVNAASPTKKGKSMSIISETLSGRIITEYIAQTKDKKDIIALCTSI
jgi:hypothetical protein